MLPHLYRYRVYTLWRYTSITWFSPKPNHAKPKKAEEEDSLTDKGRRNGSHADTIVSPTFDAQLAERIVYPFSAVQTGPIVADSRPSHFKKVLHFISFYILIVAWSVNCCISCTVHRSWHSICVALYSPISLWLHIWVPWCVVVSWVTCVKVSIFFNR